MQQYRLGCGACRHRFSVGVSADKKHCPSCGARHEPDPSWEEPVLESNPAGYGPKEPQVLMMPAISANGGESSV